MLNRKIESETSKAAKRRGDAVNIFPFLGNSWRFHRGNSINHAIEHVIVSIPSHDFN